MKSTISALLLMALWGCGMDQPKPSAMKPGITSNSDGFTFDRSAAGNVQLNCPEIKPTWKIGKEVKELVPCATYWCVGCTVKNGKVVAGKVYEELQ